MVEPAAHHHDCNDQNNRDGDCPNKERVHEGPNARSVSGDSMRFPDGGGDGSTVKRPLLEGKSADAKSRPELSSSVGINNPRRVIVTVADRQPRANGACDAVRLDREPSHLALPVVS